MIGGGKRTFKISSHVKIAWNGTGMYYRRPVSNWDDKVVYRKVTRRSKVPVNAIIQEFTEEPEEYVYLESGYSSIVSCTI